MKKGIKLISGGVPQRKEEKSASRFSYKTMYIPSDKEYVCKLRKRRVHLIILDGLGIGAMPDAYEYGDDDSNTLSSISKSKYFYTPNLQNLGLFNIDGNDAKRAVKDPIGSFGRLTEMSKGKDTVTGHWEMMGIVLDKSFPVYPNGFPKDLIEKFEKLTGKKVICNLPYSGTEVIKDYGIEHMNSGNLIVYTSADSVFQIAAHVDVVPLKMLYEYCNIARNILTGEHGVGRVIARPFLGEPGAFRRTADRKDFSLEPPKATLLDNMKEDGLNTIGIGKIEDIFAGKGLTKSFHTKNNLDGMEQALSMLYKSFEGLVFTNLVDFDMLYGHRNDIDGFAKALSLTDKWIGEFIKKMKANDVLIITADHGCDPATPSTDHSREYVPFLIYGDYIKSGINLGTLPTFGVVGATIADIFKCCYHDLNGKSIYSKVNKY